MTTIVENLIARLSAICERQTADGEKGTDAMDALLWLRAIDARHERGLNQELAIRKARAAIAANAETKE